jgi:hypothetical protein
MTSTTRSGGVRVVASLLFATAMIAGVAPASASHLTVTGTKGTAFGYSATGISLFGGAQSDTGPTPTATLALNASNSPQNASVGTGCVTYGPAVLFTSDTNTLTTTGSLGTTGSVTTTSDVQNVNNATANACFTGSEVFGYPANDPTLNPSNLKTDVAGTVTANLSGVSGSTTITNGLVRTHAQANTDCASPTTPCGRAGEAHTHSVTDPEGAVTVPLNPPPNYKVAGHVHLGATTTDYFVIVFNEQVTNRDGSLTVNPVHEYFGYKLDGSGNLVQDLSHAQGGSVLHGHLHIGQVLAGVTKTPSTPLPTISVNDTAVVEGNAGTTTATFTISLSAASTQTVTVKRVTANTTALAPGDYTALASATVTFGPGETSKTVSVTVNGDTLREGNETFRLNLSGAKNATLADTSATATIIDDEGPVWASVNDVSVVEGNAGTATATFTVSVSPAPTQTVTVTAVTANTTATAGSDYVAVPSTTLTFLAGETSKTVAVTVNGDTTVEADETFRVNLSAPTGGLVLADTFGTGTIRTDDH